MTPAPPPQDKIDDDEVALPPPWGLRRKKMAKASSTTTRLGSSTRNQGTKVMAEASLQTSRRMALKSRSRCQPVPIVA